MLKNPLSKEDWSFPKGLIRGVSALVFIPFFFKGAENAYWLFTYFKNPLGIPPSRLDFLLVLIVAFAFFSPLFHWLYSPKSWKSSGNIESLMTRKELRRLLTHQNFSSSPYENLFSSENWLLFQGSFLPKNLILGFSDFGKNRNSFLKNNLFITLVNGVSIGFFLPSENVDLVKDLLLTLCLLPQKNKEVHQWMQQEIQQNRNFMEEYKTRVSKIGLDTLVDTSKKIRE